MPAADGEVGCPEDKLELRWMNLLQVKKLCGTRALLYCLHSQSHTLECLRRGNIHDKIKLR